MKTSLRPDTYNEILDPLPMPAAHRPKVSANVEITLPDLVALHAKMKRAFEQARWQRDIAREMAKHSEEAFKTADNALAMLEGEIASHCNRYNVTSPVQFVADHEPEPEPPTRDLFNRQIMALYQPFLAKNPDVRGEYLLRTRYGVGETRLMTIEQLADLVKYMRERV